MTDKGIWNYGTLGTSPRRESVEEYFDRKREVDRGLTFAEKAMAELNDAAAQAYANARRRNDELEELIARLKKV